jgi:hypothetical protein
VKSSFIPKQLVLKEKKRNKWLQNSEKRASFW